MKSLNRTKELIDLIKNDKQIRRFQELEAIIDHNILIKTEYIKLLELQKVMVKREFEKSNMVTAAKQKYDLQLEKVIGFPFVEEYLELLDEVKSDIVFLSSIIEKEIALDFD